MQQENFEAGIEHVFDSMKPEKYTMLLPMVGELREPRKPRLDE